MLGFLCIGIHTRRWLVIACVLPLSRNCQHVEAQFKTKSSDMDALVKFGAGLVLFLGTILSAVPWNPATRQKSQGLTETGQRVSMMLCYDPLFYAIRYCAKQCDTILDCIVLSLLFYCIMAGLIESCKEARCKGCESLMGHRCHLQ